jgi:predicted amidohydrolase
LFTFSACWPAARLDQKRAMLIARALENQAAIVACNRTGNEPTINYSGGSVVLDHVGNELAAAAAETDAMLSADIDLGALRAFRSSFPVTSDIRRSFLGL